MCTRSTHTYSHTILTHTRVPTHTHTLITHIHTGGTHDVTHHSIQQHTFALTHPLQPNHTPPHPHSHSHTHTHSVTGFSLSLSLSLSSHSTPTLLRAFSKMGRSGNRGSIAVHKKRLPSAMCIRRNHESSSGEVKESEELQIRRN